MSLNDKLFSIASSAVEKQRKTRDSRSAVSKGFDVATNKSYSNEDKKVAAKALREWENNTWKPKVDAKLKQELKTRAPHLKPGTKQYQQTYDSLFNKNHKDLQAAKAKAQQQIGTLRKPQQTQRDLDNEYRTNESVRNDTVGTQAAAHAARDTVSAVGGALATGSSRLLRAPLQLAADVGENDDGGIFDRGAKALESYEDNISNNVYQAYGDIQQNGSFSQKLAVSAVEQVPALAASFGAAGVAAKGVQALGAGAKATAAASYGVAGASMYPQAYLDGSDSTKDELENATSEQLASAERSQDIYKGMFDKNVKAGMSEDDAHAKARDQTISEIAEESGENVGLATLALSMMAPGVGSFTANRAAGGAVSQWGQKVFNKLAVRADAGKAAKYAIPTAVGAGIVGLNVAEEGAQEGYTDYVAQKAAVDVGVKDKIDTAQNTEAVLMGGILGGLMGGATYVGTRNSKLKQAQDGLKAAQQNYADIASAIPQLQEQIDLVSPRSPEGQALTVQLEENKAALAAMTSEAERRGIPRTSLARRAPRIDPTNSTDQEFDGQVDGATELSEQDFENALNPDGTPAPAQPVVDSQPSEQELDAQDAQIAELIAEQQALDEAIDDDSAGKPVEESLAAAQAWYDNKRGENKQGLSGVVSRAAAKVEDTAFAEQQQAIAGTGATINDYIAAQRAKQQQIDAEIEQAAADAKTERERKAVEQAKQQREIERAEAEAVLAKRAELAQPYEGESFDTTVVGADGAPFNLARFWDSTMPAAAKTKAIADAFNGEVDQNIAKAGWGDMPEGVQKQVHQWMTGRLDAVRQSRAGGDTQSQTISEPPLAPESQQAVVPTASGLTMPVRAEQTPAAPVEAEPQAETVTPAAPVETNTATQLTDENPTINIPAPTQAKVDAAPTTDEGIYKSKPAAKAAIKKQKLDPNSVTINQVKGGGFEIVPNAPAKPSYAQAQQQAATELGMTLDENGEYGGTDAEFEAFANRVDEIQGRSLNNSTPTPVAKTEPAPNNDVAIGKDGNAKWFGKQDKAQAFIDKKGISDTHEVVQAGKRFEIQPKAQSPEAITQTSAPTDVMSENGSPNTQELTATGKARITGQAGWDGNIAKSRDLVRQLHQAGYLSKIETENAFTGGVYTLSEAAKLGLKRQDNPPPVKNIGDNITDKGGREHRLVSVNYNESGGIDSISTQYYSEADGKYKSIQERSLGDFWKMFGELDLSSTESEQVKATTAKKPKPLTDEQFAELTSSRTTPSTPTGIQSAPAKRAAAKKGVKENKVFGVAQAYHEPKQERLTVEPGDVKWRDSYSDTNAVIRQLVKKGYLEKSEFDNSNKEHSSLIELAIKGIKAEREVANNIPQTATQKTQNDVSATDNKGRFADNKLFTEDKVAAARARLKSKLTQVNSGLDPEILMDGMTLAGAYIESGVRKFGDYAKMMMSDVGPEIKPYLLTLWNGVRDYPGLDNEGMTNEVDSRAEFNKLMAEPEQASEPVGPTLTSDEKAVQEVFGMPLSNVFNIVFKKSERLEIKAKRTRNQDDQAAANKAKREARQNIMDIEQAVIDYAERKMTLGRFLDSKAGRYQELIDAVYEDRDKQAGFSGNKPSETEQASEPTTPAKTKHPKSIDVGNDKRLFVGENTEGEPIYEDKNGIRSKPEGNFMASEPVGINLGGEGPAYDVSRRADKFKTVEELSENNNDDTEAGTQDQAGAPEVRARGSDPQSGATPADSGDVATEQPTNDSATDEVASAGRPSVRGAGANVADEGSVPSQRNAEIGREGTSDTRTSNARAGKRATDSGTTSPAATKASATDLLIENPLEIVGGTPVQRFNKNREALELLQRLETESRQASPAEQKILAGYIGWGSFGQELFQGSWDHPKYKDEGVWKDRGEWLRETMGESAWKSAQRSITNAHYTDPPTVMAMWSMVERMGFTGGRVLEPSMGTGNFFSMMPAHVQSRSQLTGIELDEMTGSIAKQLFPQSNIQVMGYQESKTPDNFYDVVIGNYPFENTPVADRRYNKLNPMLHDYFFLKSMDQVRPGGLVISITSSGTMDKQNEGIRRELAKQADLVAAIRLPSGAFKDYAGTAVVTDIVILRKRAEKAAIVPEDATWVAVNDYVTPSGETIKLSQYYIDNPQNIIGTIDFGSGTTKFGAGMIVRRPDNMEERLQQAIDLVPENVMQADTTTDHLTYYANATGERHGSLFSNDAGELMLARGDQMVKAQDVTSYQVKSKATTLDRETQIKDAIDLRQKFTALVDKERAGQEAETERKALKSAYDAFTKNHGSLRDSYALKYMDRVNDPFYYDLAALEQDDGKPATIMSRSTTRGKAAIKNPSVRDAYVLARNNSVNPTLKEIAELTDKSEQEIRKELKDSGAVFEGPNGDIVPSDIYLSGNVRQKLREAEAALKDGNKAMKDNVASLKAVVPEDVPYFNIETKLGATWIPPEAYQDYIAHMLGKSDADNINVSFLSGRWKVKLGKGMNHAAEARTNYGTHHYHFSALVQAAFSNQVVRITRKIDGEEVYDHEATSEANERIAKIRGDFSEWLWSDPERRTDLEKEYNEARNAWATPKYDGSFLTFEGMALSLGKGEFNLREHQANAIWRAIVNRRSINAHEVGTGKTFTMGGIAIESRRYGIAKKPIIFAHNANSAAVAEEIRMMYPSARVLYVNNLEPKFRDIRLRQIANDDWDVIVMPHSLLDRMTLTEDTLMAMAADDIAALEQEFREAAEEDGENVSKINLDDDESIGKIRSTTAKELAKSRKRIIETIKKQAQQSSKANAVTFEDLGIDMILVDEVHEFKKPPIVTRMKMKGLNTKPSQRSIQMQFLTRYVRKMNNGGNVHTFTGTPITNTITEIYHQMRYVMETEMNEAAVSDWDGWFGSFATETQDVELSSAGDYEMVTRLAGFVNVPELRQMIGQYMDTVFAEDMPEMQPRKTESGKVMSDNLTDLERAELLNGRTEGAKDRPYKKVINESADMTAEQKRIFALVQEYAAAWRDADGKTRRKWMKDGDHRSPLIYGRLADTASFDARLLDPDLVGKEGQVPDDENSKTSRVIKNVRDIYDSHELASQVIFMDQGYGTKAKRSGGRNAQGEKNPDITVDIFSPVLDLVERLVQSGIPREQIAVVSGKTKKEERSRIAAAMNTGEIRVVIGSTQTLGVGVNMQRNLRAMHHMDAPYMPGELEQRNGRGQRQGNQWNTVLEYRYMTDRLDGKRWQILAVKQRFITAFMKAKGNARTIEGDAVEEESDILESFSEAAGDPRILQRVKLQKKQDQLNSKERLYTRGIADMRREIRTQTELAVNNQAALDAINPQAVEDALASQRDNFNVTIDGKTYDKRADATAALDEYIKKNVRLGDPLTKIGSYAGTPMSIVFKHGAPNPELVLTMGGQTFSGKGITGLESVMRNLPKQIEKKQASIEKSKATVKHLKKAVTQPFTQKAELERVGKQIKALEADLDLNPIPAPVWLRQGAPMDSEVFYGKQPFVVTGHQYSKDGYFVVAEDDKGSTTIPYLEAKDSVGMPLYDEQEFIAPEIVTKKDADSLTEEDRVPGTEEPKYSKTNPAKGLTGTTSQQVISLLQNRFGKDVVASLIKAGKLRVRTLNDFVNADGRLLIPSDAEGFYYDGKVTLIADNLTPETVVATLLHELGGHAGIQGMLSPQTYMTLMENFYNLVKSGNKYAVRAKQRAEASTYSASEARDEYIPYLITEYAQASERGGPLSVIKRFVNRVVAGVRAWVRANTGVQLKLTPNDITQLAERMVKRLAEQSMDSVTIAGMDNTAAVPQYSQESTNQTATPAFKKWFGDSKVVDSNGDPLVVYHGTIKSFNEFNTTDFGALLGRGSYFTSNESEASSYSGGGTRIVPAYLSIENPYYVDSGLASVPSRQQMLKDGHDGVIYRDTDGSVKWAVAHKPGQIKSSKNNAGTFDPNNPDIYLSRRYDNPNQLGFDFNSEPDNLLIAPDNNPAVMDQINNDEARAEWRDENKVLDKDGQKRTPVVAEAAQKYKDGEISQDEYINIVRKEMPIKPMDSVPQLPSLLDIGFALDKNKIDKEGVGIVGVNKVIEDDTRVGLRLDIPAYNNYDTWVVSIHDGTKPSGKSLGYAQTGYISNVEFATRPLAALNIAIDSPKATIARMHGDWINHDPEALAKKAEQAALSDEWIEVGMNPFRHSWFYDKADGNPVLSADEVIQIGAMVLARGARKTEVNNPEFDTGKKGNNVKFSRRYSNLGTDTSPTTAKEKAIDAAKQSAATALSSKFNLSLLLRRHLATPLHVGMLNPRFKTFFENVQARIAYENNEAGRIQEYLPEIWDTKLMVGKRKKAIDKVSRALFDGTMADQVWTDSELETRFNLDDKQKDMYRRSRAAIDSSVLNMTVDTLSSLAKGTKLVNIHTINRLKLAGLTPIGHNLMIQQHMTDELKKLSQSGSITPAAEKRLQKQLDGVFDVMDSVAVKYDDLVEKGYAPLMRFGHYAVEVRDKSNNELDLFELYETKGQQRKAIKELKEKYNENDFEVGTGTLNPDAFKQFTGKGLSPETVQLFAAELGLDTDGAHQAYLKIAISNQSALKRLIHRKKVPGYSEDLPRVLSSFVMSNARYSGRALYNGEIESAIQKIEDGNLQGEAQNVFANMENPQEEFAGVRGLLFHYYMGFSTAFMALNLTQPLTQTIPKLTAYVGAARAHRDMTQALGIITKYTGKATFEFGKKVTGNATPSWKGFEDHLPAWVKKEDYLRMTREGHLDPQNIWMIRGLERGKAGVISGLWGNLSRAAGWFAEVSETINRRGTMIAAFKVAQTMGDAKLKAEGFNSRYDFAVSIIQQTQGVYNKGNRSGLARGTGKLGQFGPLVMVFKQFSINYAEQMIRHGRDKEVKSIAVAMAWQFMLAGMLGLPFTDDLRDIVEGLLYRLFGRATNLTAFLQDELGKENADALMYGLLSEKTRFDMYGRSNMGNFIPGTDFARPKEGDWAEVIGASSGFFENFFTAGDMITKGQYKDAAVIAAPRYVRDAAAGIEIWNNGAYRNQKGDKVMDMDRTDAFIKGALQFNPASNAKQGRERSEKYHMKNMVLDKQNQFALQLTEALYQEDYDRVDELYNDMDAWNERNPEHFNVDIDKIEESAERRLDKKDFTSEDRQKLPEQLDDYFTERE